MTWSLTKLLEELHRDIEERLSRARKTIGHAPTMGDASESVWIDLLDTYLPKRYQAAKAVVVDSHGVFSEQIDVLVFDRQYSPFIFKFEGLLVVPAESVYAVFEAKQSVNAQVIGYAQNKIASVRSMHRTSLPIPFADGIYRAKDLAKNPVLGGVLALGSDWSPDMGKSMMRALTADTDMGRLDIGCVASAGHFVFQQDRYQTILENKPATAFLFKLIAMLQQCATVPMIDIEAYGAWLTR